MCLYETSCLLLVGRVRKTSSDNEAKKWIINEMESVLEAYQNGLGSNKEKFEDYTDNYLSKLANRRNWILSIIALVTSVILGLAAVDFLKDLIQRWLILILIVEAFIGTAAYVVTSFSMRHVSKNMWNIEKTFDKGFTAQNFMKGFLGIRTMDLESLNTDQLHTLHLYFITVQGGITKTILEEYERVYPNAKRHQEFYNGTGYAMYSILVEDAREFHKRSNVDFEREEFKSIFVLNGFFLEKLYCKFEELSQYLIKDPNNQEKMEYHDDRESYT